MVNYKIYQIALEIFIEITINHQKRKETYPYFKQICNDYGKLLGTKQLSEQLDQKVRFYKDFLLNEDDSLFIQETHIPYLLKTGVLVDKRDKLFVYIIIQNWVSKYNLPNIEIYKKLATTLSLNIEIATEIDIFLFTPKDLNTVKNYMLIHPRPKEYGEKLEGEWVDINKPSAILSEENTTTQKVDCPLHVYFIENEKLFLVSYHKKGRHVLKNRETKEDNICILDSGDAITTGNNESISYAEIKKKLVEKKLDRNFYLTASRAEIKYKNSKGIKPFNFIGEPGELIGIIGREGTGKSTFLRLLAGIELPSTGSVFINGYDLKKYKYQTNGFIGYVSENDLLFPELTAYENLLFASQLYNRTGNANSKMTDIDKLLKEIDIWEIRDLHVGKTTDKFIQPGHRRLLNIALELLRDPQVLIVDNSTSSLSMSDSSKVLEVLNMLTFKGKLVITTITQSCNKTFEYFDNLVTLVENGTPVFFGPKHHALQNLLCQLPEGITRAYVNKNDFSPEELLTLLYAKNEDQEPYLYPNDLYSQFIDQPVEFIPEARQLKKLPGKQSHPPRLEKQFLVYFFRNFKTKIARKKDITFALVAFPFIALLLSFLLKSSGSGSYSFKDNPNIPPFFFISIIIHIFLGLSQSVREIYKERHVLKKEDRLNLSLFSYINSKMIYLFSILALQTLLYAFIANSVLGIHGMLAIHWVIYFSCGTCGILLGLIFSSSQKSYDSIVLKSVPLSIILFILLGGSYIPLKDINLSNNKYSPYIADLSVSRWAYEAIMVEQFASNPYAKVFFDSDRDISNGAFNSYHMLPKLREGLDFVSGSLLGTKNNEKHASDSSHQILGAISSKFEKLELTQNIYPFEFIDNLTPELFNQEIADEAQEYISYLDYYFYKRYNQALKKKKFDTDSVCNLLGIENIETYRNSYINTNISNIVRNTSQRESIRFVDGEWMQSSDPIYQIPDNNMGRSQFFAFEKRFNNQILSTFEFNLSAIWLFNLLFYVILITNPFRRIFAHIK